MPEVIGWWEDEPVLGELPDPLDPFPYTAQGRAFQRIEHEQRLTQAIVNVEKLKARRRELLRL